MAKPDWKKIIGTVAPTLATALGGPLAGIAVKAIADKVLGRDDATEAEVETAILGASPDVLLKLRTLDADFKKTLVEAGVKMEEIAASDRANAREREVKANDSWTPRVIAAVVVTGYFMIQWYLLKHVVPTEMREIVMRSLGTLDMALGLVLGYYFGSSASGKNKDETIATIAKME